MNNQEQIKEQNDLISKKLDWVYEDIIGSGKLKVWKDTREPGRIILKNEFDKNFGLLMEALEKIAKQNAFDFLINLNLCEIRCSDNYQIEAGESTHQAIYNCLIKYLKKCQ